MKKVEDWRMDINSPDTECPKCGRVRMSLCLGGKHRCAKCDWSPEVDRYVNDDEIDEAYRMHDDNNNG